jgi:hypothetical protein
MKWRLKGSGDFVVRSYYEALQVTPTNSFPGKSIWCVKAPKRVSFFVWTVAWVKIITCNNLIKQSFSLVGCCCMCQCDGGMVEHLLIHCDVAYDLWCVVF